MGVVGRAEELRCCPGQAHQAKRSRLACLEPVLRHDLARRQAVQPHPSALVAEPSSHLIIGVDNCDTALTVRVTLRGLAVTVRVTLPEYAEGGGGGAAGRMRWRVRAL